MNRLNLRLRIADYLWIARRQVVTAFVRRPPAEWSRGRSRPVVLLPGVWERWPILAELGDRLNAHGHPVHVVPALGFNRGPIPRGASMVTDRLIDLDLTGAVLLAHSKGGLIGKAVLLGSAGDRVDRLVAISTPFGGSRWARLMLTPSLREFRPRGATIAAMSAQLGANGRIVSIFGPFDPHIPEGSLLLGATNVELPVQGHFLPLGDEGVAEAVRAATTG